MKKKYIYYGIVVVVVAVVAYMFLGGSDDMAQEYSYSEVTKGDVNVTITSSGTLEALSTVDVGTQVSGEISKILVDYNDQVTKGQLIAILDTVTLAAEVEDAQAALEQAQAEYNEAVAINDRNQKLYEKKYLSELDYIESQTDVESTKATLKSSQSALNKAKQNLGYAYIKSPINGIVIDRDVEEGQTVAASYSTPTLFTIVKDLDQMRILADVDESDIGSIEDGQSVEFTVQAYSEKTFTGKVTQIRLNPTTSSSVVMYTVVILADNEDHLLLPGMTATVDFFVQSSKNALRVPNTALRFSPTDEMVKEASDNMKEAMSSNDGNGEKRMTPPDSSARPDDSETIKEIWYLDANSKLMVEPVVTGITDGKYTEILHYKNLKEGTKVITGVLEISSSSSSSSTTNALTGQNNNRGMRGFGGPPPH